MGRALILAAALLLAGCGSGAAKLYAEEAGAATQQALHLDSYRSAKAIGDCLVADPTRRVALIDLARKVRDEAAGATYDRVLIGREQHVVVRITDVPLGAIVMAHVRPGRTLSPFLKNRLEMCAGGRR
jgi:hypothetical protein